MASTYSTNLKIELITTGEQLNTWGVTTNNNLGTAIEQAIVGRGDVQFTNDANLTLSLANSNAAQPARAFFLDVTSTLALSAQRDLIVPTIEKPYAIRNATTGGQSIRIKTSAGTGVVVPNGARMMVYTDGVNVIEAVNTLTSPSLIGTPTAPTAAPGTNSTQLATTAFVNAIIPIGGFGTMASQNANSVAITGGSITGITDLAVADGGTGASTAANARTNLGLGTIATQNSNSVSITGGSITGITDLAIADGGTGASTASQARTNLGLGTVATENIVPIASGGTGATTTSQARANLNVPSTDGTGAFGGGWNIGILGVAANVSGTVAIANGGTGATTAANARTALGLGSLATQNSNNVSLTGGLASNLTMSSLTISSSSFSGGTVSGLLTDLAVADGGTGASSFTANTVLLGNGTSAFQTVAPSTSGNVLTSNGTTWVSSPVGGISSQSFTANGTFTIPAGVTRLKVTVVGGGGGGCNGGGFSQNATRGAGGGGATAIKYLTGLTPGNTLLVTVGVGGATNTQPGGNGGNSQVSSGTQSITTITGGGGVGGQISTNTAGGTANNGDINIPGGTGLYGGLGGQTTFGGGSGAGAFPQAGLLYGGGGTSQFNAIGAVGAHGIVIFEW